ncbi:MAG: type II secretion system protein [Candidatus Didemnitutus sp.]|nr:type II secretion system protein [Candidatus Didemnitutus sp.]
MKPLRSKRSRAFTLLELLVVMGMVAALSFVFVGALGGGKGAALESGQALMANYLIATRTKSMTTGQSARLLINVEVAGTAQPARYLRYVVLQVHVDGVWQTTSDAYLPAGVFVLPGNFSVLPAGLFPNASGPWTKSDGSNLRSTALRANNIVFAMINGENIEQWASVSLAAAGTTASSGDLIVGSGRIRAPGSYGAGESPVELEHPDQVRGLSLSTYGVATLINRRESF